jgi:hypothetical protein
MLNNSPHIAPLAAEAKSSTISHRLRSRATQPREPPSTTVFIKLMSETTSSRPLRPTRAPGQV